MSISHHGVTGSKVVPLTPSEVLSRLPALAQDPLVTSASHSATRPGSRGQPLPSARQAAMEVALTAHEQTTASVQAAEGVRGAGLSSAHEAFILPGSGAASSPSSSRRSTRVPQRDGELIEELCSAAPSFKEQALQVKACCLLGIPRALVHERRRVLRNERGQRWASATSFLTAAS